MTENTLRALSRTYAAGDIDRENYRLKRRQLLDAIEAGTEPVHVFEPPEPETPTVFPYDDDDGDTTQEILPQVDLADSGNRGARGVAIAAVIGVIVIAAAWAGWQWLQQEPAPDVAVAPPVAETRDLLQRFVADGVWSSTAMTRLRNTWDGLPRSARDELRVGPGVGDFSSELAAQLGAEEALIGLGDAAGASAKQRELLDLADHIGLTDTRFDRAEERWLARQADAAATLAQTAADTGTDAASQDLAASEPGDAADMISSTAAALAATPDAMVIDAEPAPAPAATPEPPAVSAPDPVPEPEPEPEPTAVTTPATAPVAPVTEPDAPSPAAAAPAPTTPASASAPLRSNCKAALAEKRRPYCIDVLESGTKGPVLVVLPPGQFEMGGDEPQEQPRHKVTINYPFAISLFEISAAELNRYCAATGTTCPPQPWSDSELPAVNVSWRFAAAYAAWLSDITGVVYRLPSEAEWEYAARAGTATMFPFGDELLPTHARFSFKTVLDKPLPANDRSVNRNEFRLFHMVGNVREWVADGWRDHYRDHRGNGIAVAPDADRHVVRGGSYADPAERLRSAARTSLGADDADAYTGFRVVRNIEQ